MKIYLVRHGDYSIDAETQLDELSEKGHHEIQQLVSFIKPFAYPVAAILHSHKNRAKETASLLSPGFDSTSPPTVYDGLNPNDDVELMASELDARNEDLVLVGHLPFLNKLTSLLLVGEAELELINFKTGTMVCLEKMGPEKWLLCFMLCAP